jgi:hypothetical protein
MNPPATPLLDAALSYAERGWHVFPLVRGAKRPVIDNWEQRATTNPDRIERAWTAHDHNIGIACGPSDLVVIDLDRPKPGAMPPPAYRRPGIRDGADVLAMLCDALDQPFPADTYSVLTGSGGTHLYFANPQDVELRNTTGRLGWLIDARANGGYVVAAGSVVAGRPYTVFADTPLMRLPAWLAERLAQPAPASLSSAAPVLPRNASAYAAAALRGELDRVLNSADRQHNSALYAAASALGQLVSTGLLDRAMVEQALILAGQAVGQPLPEAAGTVRSGLESRRGTTPRPIATEQPTHRPAA